MDMSPGSEIASPAIRQASGNPHHLDERCALKTGRHRPVEAAKPRSLGRPEAWTKRSAPDPRSSAPVDSVRSSERSPSAATAASTPARDRLPALHTLRHRHHPLPSPPPPIVRTIISGGGKNTTLGRGIETGSPRLPRRPAERRGFAPASSAEPAARRYTRLATRLSAGIQRDTREIESS